MGAAFEQLKTKEDVEKLCDVLWAKYDKNNDGALDKDELFGFVWGE